jgi:predicted transcriptional regulator
VLWTNGRCTETEVQRHLRDDRGWAYSTTKTVLDRMASKHVVLKHARGHIHEYAATHSREHEVERLLESTAQQYFGGSMFKLLRELIARSANNPDEIRQLREVVRRQVPPVTGDREDGNHGRL